ncbi:PAS domain S-box protein [Allocoleopsis sp.]|uniref:PAS domain S-box protein n=1 Tax=Allocoleopsis sp. TaxID=3088169 RepID=UPI002FD6BFD4
MKRDRLASPTHQDPKVEIESQLRHLLGQVMCESGELHRLILSSISEIIFITDNSGVLTFVSPNVQETFGYSSYEIQELDNISQLLGDNLFRWQDLDSSGEISNIEREIIDKAGRRRTLLINIKQVSIRGGTLLYSCRDVSDRKQTEQALQARDRQLRAFFEGAIDAVLIADDEGRYVDANPAACELLGLCKADVLGCRISDFAEPHFDFAQAWCSFLEQGRVTGEFCLLRPDGTMREVEYASTANFLPHRHLAVLRDITQRKQVEAEILALKTQLEQGAIAPAGEMRWQQWTDCPIFNPQGGFVAFQSVARDVAEPKPMEQGLAQSDTYYQIISELTTECQQTEAVLRESEERFRATFEQAVVGISHCALNGEFVRVNRKFCDLMGYTQEELLALSWRDITHPDDQRAGEDYTRSLLVGEIEHYSCEKRYIRKDGGIFWGNLTLSLLREPSGEPKYLVKVLEDITERKRAQEERREATERMELVIRASNDGFWDWNLLTGEIYFSPRWKEMIGYTDDELPNQVTSWEKVLFPEDRITTLKRLEDYNSGKISRFLITQRFHHKNGSTVYVFSRAMHLKNEQGQVVRMIGAHTDITDLVNAQEALRSLTQREQEKATQLELALQELQQAQTQLVQQEKMASLGQLVAGVAHEINNPVSFIYGNINPASGYTQDLLHLLELYQQHYPQPAPEIAEQLKIADLEFIAEDFPKLLVSMQNGADRIRQIVLSLRNFSRHDQTELKSVDIHEGIDSTLLILQHRLKPQPDRPEIRVVREYGQLPQVECYPGQLNQVFMNLLSNAIDALEESGCSVQNSGCSEKTAENEQGKTPFTPTIRIRTEVIEHSSGKSDRTACPWTTNHDSLEAPTQPKSPEEPERSSSVVIYISDNGSGMKIDVHHQIFNPFFTTKPPGKGTGLGLSISYHIVNNRHNGQLFCRSAQGQGAEFVIEIPISQCQSNDTHKG